MANAEDMACDDGQELDTQLREQIQFLENGIRLLRPQVERYTYYLELLEQHLVQVKTLCSGAPPPGRLRGVKPSKAACHFLKSENRPLARADVVSGLLACGCARDTTSDEGKRRQAVGVGVKRAVSDGKLISRGGKLWLPEWIDDPAFARYNAK